MLRSPLALLALLATACGSDAASPARDAADAQPETTGPTPDTEGDTEGDAEPEVEEDTVEDVAADAVEEVADTVEEVEADAVEEVAADTVEDVSADAVQDVATDATDPGDAITPPVGVTSLDGPADDRAAAHLPWLRYAPDLARFAVTDDEPEGLPRSLDTFLVVLEDGATVASVNAALAALDARIVGTIPPASATGRGLAMVRTSASDAAERDADRAALRASQAFAVVVEDTLTVPQRVPGPDHLVAPIQGDPDYDPQPATVRWDWTGRFDPALTPDANWGLELMGFPAAWNLLHRLEARDAPPVAVAVIDVGFDATHPDLPNLFVPYPNPPTATPGDIQHGTHVAGTIGAHAALSTGVSGAAPRGILIGIATDGAFASHAQETQVAVLAYSARVTNNSWSTLPDDPVAAAAVAARTSRQARHEAWSDALAEVMDDLAAAFPARQSVYVYAAGNHHAAVFAKESNQGCNLAVTRGRRDVYCVEALDVDLRHADFSNLGGTHSAPGVGILSTAGGGGYLVMGGTSMAAPHVAGLLAWLITARPDITAAALRSVVDDPYVGQVPVDGGAPYVDAYEALLRLDRGEVGHPVLTMLADVDDGTADGNTRVLADGQEVSALVRTGDGAVDMRDFRVFRDLYLDLTGAFVDLDGGPHNPMLDANMDGVVSGTGENRWPLLDLDGSGRLDDATHILLGFEHSDLELFGSVFSDPDVTAEELPGLLDSGDLHLDVSPCYAADPDIVRIEAAVLSPDGSDLWPMRDVDVASPEVVFTVPAGLAWDPWLRVTMSDGSRHWRLLREVTVQAGQDLRISTCGDVGVVACTNFDDHVGWFDEPCGSFDAPDQVRNGELEASAEASSDSSARTAMVSIGPAGVCADLWAAIDGDAIRASAAVSFAVTPTAFETPPTAFYLRSTVDHTTDMDEAAVLIEVIDADGYDLGQAYVYYSEGAEGLSWDIRGSDLWVIPDGETSAELPLDLAAEPVILVNLWASAANFTNNFPSTTSASLTIEYPFGACEPPSAVAR